MGCVARKLSVPKITKCRRARDLRTSMDIMGAILSRYSIWFVQKWRNGNFGVGEAVGVQAVESGVRIFGQTQQIGALKLRSFGHTLRSVQLKP